MTLTERNTTTMYRYLSRPSIAWTARLGLAIVLLSLSLLAAAPRRASAAIVTVNVNPHGSGLEFSASTTSAVTWEFWLSTSSIVTSPYPPHFQSLGVRYVSGANPSNSFSPAFYNLVPNRTYNYIVRGGSTYLTGSVKTLKNRVTVTFNKIDVIDDSDALGAGELTFYFNAGSGFFQQFGEVSASSGASLSINTATIIFFNKVGSLNPMVEGVDDDIDFLEACRSGQPPDGTTGSDNCFDWATAQTSINIPQFAGLNNNFTQKTVSFETTANRLKFRAFALITVEYGANLPG